MLDHGQSVPATAERNGVSMTPLTRRRLGRVAITVGSVVLFAAALSAQSSPPIPGVTGVLEPEGTKNGAIDAVAAVAGKTVEGTRRLLRAMGIGGDNGENTNDPLAALQLGATVIVQDGFPVAAVPARTQGDAQTAAEARVIDINRRTGVIVIRLSDRTTETLQLTGRTGGNVDLDAGASQEAGGTVSVSYVDGNGQRVVLSFRKTS
jgi:hypothetical protein